jgi:DTW domain-containing protein
VAQAKNLASAARSAGLQSIVTDGPLPTLLPAGTTSAPSPRPMCYRCRWPQAQCWCASLPAMQTRTRFVILMHPKEAREKAGTGRLTHLAIANSALCVGASFPNLEDLPAHGPEDWPVLLYPGKEALNLSEGALPAQHFGGRRLVVYVLDATWACARKMLRLSPALQALPRVMFTPQAPSRFVIKQQPQAGCLSTLEAVHETLLALRASGLDDYPSPTLLLEVFARMQRYQIECARDPARGGYRRKPYGDPGERVPTRGKSAARRQAYLKKPDTPQPAADDLSQR